MAFLRHAQRAFTAISPHQANKRWLIPKRVLNAPAPVVAVTPPPAEPPPVQPVTPPVL